MASICSLISKSFSHTSYPLEIFPNPPFIIQYWPRLITSIHISFNFSLSLSLSLSLSIYLSIYLSYPSILLLTIYLSIYQSICGVTRRLLALLLRTRINSLIHISTTIYWYIHEFERGGKWWRKGKWHVITEWNLRKDEAKIENK